MLPDSKWSRFIVVYRVWRRFTILFSKEASSTTEYAKWSHIDTRHILSKNGLMLCAVFDEENKPDKHQTFPPKCSFAYCSQAWIFSFSQVILPSIELQWIMLISTTYLRWFSHSWANRLPFIRLVLLYCCKQGSTLCKGLAGQPIKYELTLNEFIPHLPQIRHNAYPVVTLDNIRRRMSIDP